MAAATAITPLDRPRGHFQQFSFTLDPASIAAAGREVETVAIPGAAIGDGVVVSPQSGLLAGLAIAYARVVSAGSVEFAIINYSAGAVDQGSGVWTLTLTRGTTMAFAR